jgi:hypothetical protein
MKFESSLKLLLETRPAEIRTDVTGRLIDSIVAVCGSRQRDVIRPRLGVFATGAISGQQHAWIVDQLGCFYKPQDGEGNHGHR